MPFSMPINGTEPTYNEQKWNQHADKTTNCYAYSLNFIYKGDVKPTPGERDRPPYTCSKLETGLFEDVPGIIKLGPNEFNQACPVGHHKIFLTVSHSPKNDFHFYRQDADQYWSHKPGSLPPRRTDADGRLITVPHLANSNYPSFNYDDHCGYYCVPTLDPNLLKSNLDRREI